MVCQKERSTQIIGPERRQRIMIHMAAGVFYPGPLRAIRRPLDRRGRLQQADRPVRGFPSVLPPDRPALPELVGAELPDIARRGGVRAASLENGESSQAIAGEFSAQLRRRVASATTDR